VGAPVLDLTGCDVECGERGVSVVVVKSPDQDCGHATSLGAAVVTGQQENLLYQESITPSLEG